MPVQQDSFMLFNDYASDGKLNQFVIDVPTVPVETEGSAVKEIFENKPDCEGIVVMENKRPAGLIMRTTFYQKIGSLYGHSLYMKRPVRILMEESILSVDVSENLSKIGIQAMNREQSKLYDYIIVYRSMSYLGVISIRLFLVELSKRNEAQISVLTQQQQKLLTAHEQETLLRKNLEYQSASISNLLDHADEGFLWFSSDLQVKNEYSYKCMDIFQHSIGGMFYSDLVEPFFPPEKSEVFKLVFESYFENTSPVTDTVYLMLLPSDCMINGKNIHFEYRRIESGGQKGIMVILNDITEKIAMEKAIEEDRDKQRLILKAIGYQTQIKQMLGEFQEVFSGGFRDCFTGDTSFQNGLSTLFRSVHTFKGDLAQYGLLKASEHVHRFEEELLALVNRNEEANMAEVEAVMRNADPEKMLEEDLGVIHETLGESYFEQNEMLSVPKTKLLEIEEHIFEESRPFERREIAALVRSLAYKNVKVFLNQYRDYLQYLSARILKNMPVFIVEGDDVEIDSDEYGGFFKSLVHIFRNIMDHGLETDEERLECGKSEKGLVECHITRIEDDQFRITISDDGKGVDTNKLKNKAIERKLYTAEEASRMSEQEAIELVFSDHLSTKENADSLSGRGVGMSAVREACERLNGRIEITTESGRGTMFLITLPCSNT